MANKDFHIQGAQINQFNNIAPNSIPRSTFIRDYPYRTTFDVNNLVPFFVDEILPGDDVHLKLTALTRIATPIKPIMENLYQETFWFFVPYRLVWDNWEKLQGMQINPGDSVEYSMPKFNMTGKSFAVGTVADYFGIATDVTNLEGINSVYHRGYQLIWNEWFRDENLQNSITIPKGDGPDSPDTMNLLLKRNKRKDYRTSCLPWPQKGDAVSISIGGNLPVTILGKVPGNLIPIQGTTNPVFTPVGGTANQNLVKTGGGSAVKISGPTTPAGDAIMAWGSNTGLTVAGGAIAAELQATADGSDLTAITINELRQAALYQQILELDARGGTRYVEAIYSRFGVISPDFRLQRPELIGQGSSRINVYAVPQTSATTEDSTPQGNLAAFGTNIIGNHGCRYSATEHGMILGLMNVRADLTYQQAVPRMFTRSTRLDFYEPLLNGLGEQVVFNNEVMATGTPTDQNPFGYQERFAEYRYRDPMITGKFRSTAAGTLDIWHLSQEFATPPALNSSFITENVPMDRVVAVTDEPDFLFESNISYRHTRAMPMRSNPGITRL